MPFIHILVKGGKSGKTYTKPIITFQGQSGVTCLESTCIQAIEENNIAHVFTHCVRYLNCVAGALFYSVCT
mgnify:CR=1 FL=1